MSKTVLTVCTLLLLSTITAQPSRADDWDLSGYLKTLFVGSRSFFDENYLFAIHRLRTQILWLPRPSVGILAALDNQVSWGNYLDTKQYSLARPLEDRFYVDLALDPLDGTKARWRAEFYRLYLRVTSEKADFSVGRQRIAWGTGRLWNPTDLFNPTSPLQIEPAEKRGADSVALTLRPIDGLQIELAAGIGADREDVRWGARGRTTVANYEISLMAGRFRESDVVGFDFSGYLGDSGFRGEFTHTWEPSRSFLRGVLSFEHTFRNGITLLSEYLYNGGNVGRISVESIENLAAFDSITTLNRHFLALQLSRQLSPLLWGSLLAIADLEDGGFFLSPTLSYSWKQNVDVIIGAQLFFAGEGDFSLGHPTAIAAVEWYF